MLSWIAVQNEADSIERDLELRARRALDRAGQDWASIVFSGRDGVMVGTARRPQERTEALTLVRAVWGVRAVEDRMRLASEPVVVAPDALAARELKPRTVARAAIERAGRLSPAVPLSAHTFVAREAGSLADAAPVLVAPEMPAAVAARRPQLVAVTTREVGNAPELSGKAADADTAPDRPRSYTVVARERADVPLPARKTAIGRPRPATAIGRDSADVPLPSRTAAAAPARSARPDRGPLVTATVGDDGTKPDAECRAAVLGIGMSGEIRFTRGKADLDGRGRALLDQLAEVARVCPRLSLNVAGHADSRGAAQRNLKLSRRRAAVAARYLINKGIDAGRLQAVGYGETRPVAPNDTAENRAKNRRIEVDARDLQISPTPTGQGAGNGLPDR